MRRVATLETANSTLATRRNTEYERRITSNTPRQKIFQSANCEVQSRCDLSPTEIAIPLKCPTLRQGLTKIFSSYEFFLNLVMSDPNTCVYKFGRFKLDAGKQLLFCDDEIVPVTPKAFDTLLALIEQHGSVLSKEELMRRVWPDQFVEENNLAQSIFAIRRALECTGEGVSYVQTIPKRGYRFVGEVEVLTADITDSSSNVIARALGQSAGGQGLPVPTISARQAPLVELNQPSLMPKTHYVVSTGDVNIAYQVIGEGPLDLVFVMGWVSHLEYFWREPSFARFLTRLASFSRLILFDKRGTGLSDRVQLADLPSLEQRITDVQAVMDAVGSKRAALLGVSEGGPLCSLFAATHPDRTSALVMIGTYAKRIWSEDYPWAPTPEARSEFLEEIKHNWGEPVGLEERAPSMVNDPAFREWWATYLRMGASPSAALALTQMNAEIDVCAVLPSVRVPSLIIHRTNDACLPVEGGHYVAQQIPGAKFLELPGRDHLPFVGDQDAILDEIEEFLTGARHEPEVDRVLTTVAFVFFEPDSQAPSKLEPAERDSLHQAYVRRELALFRGKEMEMDSDHLFATFDGPARAIRCTRAIVAAAERLGLRVRAGLHTGDCEIRGESVGGVTVRLGEAVACKATPGEILISHTVKDLLAGSGIDSKLRDVASFENLPGEWVLYSVTA